MDCENIIASKRGTYRKIWTIDSVFLDAMHSFKTFLHDQENILRGF